MAKLNEFPEEGELVVGTVHKVQNFGAFVLLEEYPQKEGFVHIREVAAGWVKRIRDHVREQQRVVCKVNSVDKKKGHIDLSLKSVNAHQRRETIQNWKNEQKADKLIEMYAAEQDTTVDAVLAEITKPLLEVWDRMYDALQELAEYGEDVAKEVGLEGEWVDPLVKFCGANIQANFVEVAGFVELSSLNNDGLKLLTKALVASEKSEFDDVKIQAAYNGAPLYRLTVQAPDFKIAEEQLKGAADRAITIMEKGGGKGMFHREMEE